MSIYVDWLSLLSLTLMPGNLNPNRYRMLSIIQLCLNSKHKKVPRLGIPSLPLSQRQTLHVCLSGRNGKKIEKMRSNHCWCAVTALFMLIACAVNVQGQDGSTLEEIQNELQEIQTTLDTLGNLVIPTTTTEGATTAASEQSTPSAQPSSTHSGTSEGSTTGQTLSPSTDMQSTTAEPTTKQPTTPEPTTKQPTTPEPTTKQPTTPEPTTAEPTTKQPTTPEPTTPEPTTKASGRLLRYRGRHVLSSRDEDESSTTTSDSPSTHSSSSPASTNPLTSTSEPAPPLCIENDDENEDLCARLVDVLDDIEKVTTEITAGEAGEPQLEDLKNCSARLDDVVAEANTKPDFLETIDKDQFKQKKDQLDKVIQEAETVVQEKLNPEDPYDPTVAIVLGVLGGLVALALVGYGGFVFYKKRKEEEGDKRKSGLANPGFEVNDNKEE
ncbi:mucin-5AC-like [Penaeus japonicus]|uniref:mucin-5AC-like n=1 Tax=Penaeus japonicus TaxID=27405 RepID=UPI001C70D3D0|nr:mucin-5AC-like [Penaeus japonicus]